MQDDLLKSYGLNPRHRKGPRCFLCTDNHNFEVCPQIPPGSLPEERQRLRKAGRSNNVEEKNSLLSKIWTRIDQEAATKAIPPPHGRSAAW